MRVVRTLDGYLVDEDLVDALFQRPGGAPDPEALAELRRRDKRAPVRPLTEGQLRGTRVVLDGVELTDDLHQQMHLEGHSPGGLTPGFLARVAELRRVYQEVLPALRKLEAEGRLTVQWDPRTGALRTWTRSPAGRGPGD
jgi:hypothetical protein